MQRSVTISSRRVSSGLIPAEKTNVQDQWGRTECLTAKQKSPPLTASLVDSMGEGPTRVTAPHMVGQNIVHSIMPRKVKYFGRKLTSNLYTFVASNHIWGRHSVDEKFHWNVGIQYSFPLEHFPCYHTSTFGPSEKGLGSVKVYLLPTVIELLTSQLKLKQSTIKY